MSRIRNITKWLLILLSGTVVLVALACGIAFVATREALRDLNQLEQKYSDLVRQDRANEEAATMLADAQARVASFDEKLRRRDIELQKLQAQLADEKAQATALTDSLNAKIASLNRSSSASRATSR